MKELQRTPTLSLIAAALFAAFILMGCSATKKHAPDDVAYSNGEQIKALNMDPKSPDYIIGTEDIIEVSVWKNEELSKVVVVRPDGMISLPLIGDLKAAGKTPAELRDEVTVRLQEYQETVVASVIVQEARSYRIFVLGEVLNPGTYIMTRRTSVLQAIALAGGFSQYASRNKITLIRERPGRGEDSERIKIRFDDIVDSGGSKETNLTLRPGDTIFVP